MLVSSDRSESDFKDYFAKMPWLSYLSGSDLLAHFRDGSGIVVAAEYGGTGHEGIGAGRGYPCDVVAFDAAVDLQADVPAAGVNDLPGALQFLQTAFDERLTAETRVD